MIDRPIDYHEIQQRLSESPATAILGSRQCGKTTLAKMFPAARYFDLENPVDLRQLETAQLTLEKISGLVVIDEIQLRPDLFPLLRYLIDSNPEKKYLILGSASRDLIRQSSESLAGRIAYYQLAGIRPADVGPEKCDSLWLRGHYPRAVTADTDAAAFRWLGDYITTFLERDIPQLGITIPAQTLRRFWTMLANYHAQMMNYSEFGRSFGVSDFTIKKYLDILSGTFMVRALQPWYQNIGKRLVKRPKIYMRDSGIFHALLSIDSTQALQSHPKLGASWEGFALETAAQSIGKRDEELYYWRTHTGSEVDLFWMHQGKNWAVEFKYSDAPKMTKSIHHVLEDLKLEHLWVVYPGKTRYPLNEKVTVLPITEIGQQWNYIV
ncbi:MAG: ATP-binding protein [Planctomycetota bacterium]|jgi:predicted AAA+ superfamily ATPase